MIKDIINNKDLIFITDCKNDIKKYISSLDKIVNYKCFNVEDLKGVLLDYYNEEALHDIYKVDGSLYRSIKLYKALNVFINNSSHYPSDMNKMEELKRYSSLLVSNVEQTNLNKIKLIFDNKDIVYYVENETLLFSIAKAKLKSLNYNVIEIRPKKIESLLPSSKFTVIQDEAKKQVKNVCETIEKGVNTSEIVIYASDAEYISYLTMYLRLNKIGYTYFKQNQLNSYPAIKKIINDIESNNLCKDKYYYDLFSQILNETKEGLPTEPLNTLFNILNKYNKYKVDKYYNDIICYELNNAKVEVKDYEGLLLTTSFNDIVDFKYVFICGAYNGSLPSRISNNSYFNKDELFELFGYDLIKVNDDYANFMNERLHNINYLSISYSEILNGYNMVKSPFIEEGIKEEENYQKVYSRDQLILDFAGAKDLYVKYLMPTTPLGLSDCLGDVPYKSYDYNFKGFSQDTKNAIKEKQRELSISYTQLDNYFNCPFKYYATKYFKDYKKDDDLIILGDLFHYVLEQLEDNKIKENIESNIDKFIIEFETNLDIDQSNDKVKFYNSVYKDWLVKIYRNNLDFMSRSNYEFECAEKEFLIHKDVDGYMVKIKGKIDKVLKYNNHYMVVDYKTGKLHLNIYAMEYGLNMQLPTYLYALRNIYPNCFFGGAYYQKIIPDKPFDFDEKKTIEEQLKKTYILDGLLPNDDNDIADVCVTGNKNEYLYGKNAGQKKVMKFNETMFDSMVDFVDNKIEDGAKSILDFNFKIEPVNYSSNCACDLCNFKGLCYNIKNNVKSIEIDKEFGFLGGKDDE